MAAQKYSIVQQILQSAQQKTPEKCPEGGSDLKPHPGFNPAEDVDALEKALSAKDVDKGHITDILANRTNQQRQEIKAAYQKKTGKSLEEAIKKALSGKLGNLLSDMLKTPAEFDAAQLNAAIKGPKINEDVVNEILITRSNQDIRKIKDVYKAAYKTDLNTDITKKTSGDYQKTLLALLKGERSEDCHVNEDQADKDAKALLEAGEKKKKADTFVFTNIFTQRSFINLVKIFNNYAKESKHKANQPMDLQMDADVERSLVDIAKVAESKPGYFAEKLNLAMKGSQEEAVARIMVSRQEVDMTAIKAHFKKISGKSLREALNEGIKTDFALTLIYLNGK